jgi:hypothetical protein
MSRSKPKHDRQKVTTTLSAKLWKDLQVAAINEDRDANDILEELIEGYLKKPKQKGGAK